MSQQKSEFINCLRQLMPPDAVIDIGIGAGLGEMHQWRDWDVSIALLVDVDSNRSQWVERLIEQRETWYFEPILLADTHDEENDFFVSSNRAESSVLTVDALQTLWPNMQLREQRKISTYRLDNLLASTSLHGFGEANCIWGVVDCLAALPVLKGAGAELERWSVLWVRVLLQEVSATTDEQSSLEVISVFLESLGYRCVEVVEENHPALGRALFVRDWQSWLQSQVALYQAEANKQRQIVNGHEQKLTLLQKECDMKIGLAQKFEQENARLKPEKASALKQVQQLTQVVEQKVKHIQDYEQKIAQLTPAKESVVKQVKDLNNQVQQLTQAVEKKVKHIQDYEQKIAQLTPAKESAMKQVKDLQNQVAQLSRVKQNQEKQIDNYKKQVNDLQQQLQEHEHRQKLLDEEFVKAEAQIELIKDVLLKEKAL